MAVIFDQAQGQYPVNQPPTPPIKPIKSDYIYGNKDIAKKSAEYTAAMEKYENQLEVYNRNKTEYNQQQAQKQTEEDQKALWEREDALREHVEQREDTALQRWVEDARKAGINPNLALGATGAASGGGITNASQKNYTLENTVLQGEINQALADLERAFQKDENAKDRLNRVFSSLGLGTIMKIGK